MNTFAATGKEAQRMAVFIHKGSWPGNNKNAKATRIG